MPPTSYGLTFYFPLTGETQKPKKKPLSQSLTFATGDRFINRVAAMPWPSPLHVKDAFTYFFHIKDHSVRTSIFLAFCCVRARCGGGWVGTVTHMANMAKLLSSSQLWCAVLCPSSLSREGRWGIEACVLERARARSARSPAGFGAHCRCVRCLLANVLKFFVLPFPHSRMTMTYCPLGGSLCIQTRRYKFWNTFFEHVESM